MMNDIRTVKTSLDLVVDYLTILIKLLANVGKVLLQMSDSFRLLCNQPETLGFVVIIASCDDLKRE